MSALSSSLPATETRGISEQEDKISKFMFNANILNVAYLAFRLAPFILVSFFTLQSFLNWDLKGIVYLAGLIFTTFFILLTENYIKNGNNVDRSSQCSLITITKDQRKIPLSTVVFSYTFLYLIALIINMAQTPGANISPLDASTGAYTSNNLSTAMQENIPTLILFPVLLILDTLWILSYSCFDISWIFWGFMGGALGGLIWAAIIAKSNNPDLMYISSASLGDTCSRPTKQLFRCRIPTSVKK